MSKENLGNITLRVSSRKEIIIPLLYLLLSYPLFYFSYKFCLPDLGGEDFYAYYPLYKNWEFEKVDCPFNMRLISSFMIFIMNKIGFSYDTEISFTAFHPEYDQQVFFNALLFNFICVLISCIVIYKTVQLISGNELYSFLFGVIYLLGFGTIFFSLKPATDSSGVLLLALIYYYYLKQNKLAFLFLFLSLFQREYIFFIFGLISLFDLFYKKNRYYLRVFLFSIFLFIVYYILRKTLFYTPRFEHQVAFDTYYDSLFNPDIVLWPFLKQSFFISNIFILYLLVIIYKKLTKIEFSQNFFLQAVFLFVQVIAISLLSRLGNNAGRYFYYTVPILLFFLSFEGKALVSKFLVDKKNV